MGKKNYSDICRQLRHQGGYLIDRRFAATGCYLRNKRFTTELHVLIAGRINQDSRTSNLLTSSTKAKPASPFGFAFLSASDACAVKRIASRFVKS